MARGGRRTRDNKRFADDHPYVVELMRLEEENDGLTPELVLSEAKRKRSPLHDWFEWDDGAAAAAWRLQQARRLIQVVTVEIVGGHETSHPVRALVSISTPSGRKYQKIGKVMSNKKKREQLLVEALEAHQTWERRYHTLDELASVFAAARRVRKKAV